MPASHCGVYGFRPTHGAVSTTGVWPLAPRFDTVGWLAREPRTLTRAAGVLLPPRPSGIAGPARLLIADQATALLDPEARPAFTAAAATVARRLGRTAEKVELTVDGWLETYLALQNSEAVALHRAWLTRHGSALGSLIPAVGSRAPWPSPPTTWRGPKRGRRSSPPRYGLCWATTAGCCGPAPPARRRAAASPTTRSTRTQAGA